MRGRFTRIQLGNWRNFKRVDADLQPRVFVVGPNASGKSNLLDALRFVRDLAIKGGGLTNALEASNRGGIRSVRSLHATSNSRVTVAVEAEIDGVRWLYRLVLAADRTPHEPDAARVVEERVERNSVEVLKRPDELDRGDPERLLTTALEQPAGNLHFRALRDFLRSVEYIHVVPQLVRTPAQGDIRRFGKGLGTGLIDAMGELGPRARKARLNRIQAALKTVLPQFERLDWLQDKRGIPHLRAKYTHWRRQGAWQHEAAFSDGTLRLIGLLWFLAESGGPLLLEEPEMSLHPAAVRQLPRIIANVAEGGGRQVIMTSHSVDLLSDTGIEPREIQLLETTGSETTVRSGANAKELVEAAAADEPLAGYVEALTRPEKYAQLALFGADE